MKIKTRVEQETPVFFKRLRNYGLALASLAGGIISAPATFGITLPAAIITAAGYLAVAGTVAAGVSQLVTADKPEDLNDQIN